MQIRRWWQEKSFSEQQVWGWATGLSLLLYSGVGHQSDWFAPTFIGFVGGIILIITFVRLLGKGVTDGMM